jgi:hypothetical protein
MNVSTPIDTDTNIEDASPVNANSETIADEYVRASTDPTGCYCGLAAIARHMGHNVREIAVRLLKTDQSWTAGTRQALEQVAESPYAKFRISEYQIIHLMRTLCPDTGSVVYLRLPQCTTGNVQLHALCDVRSTDTTVAFFEILEVPLKSGGRGFHARHLHHPHHPPSLEVARRSLPWLDLVVERERPANRSVHLFSNSRTGLVYLFALIAVRNNDKDLVAGHTRVGA